MLLLVLFVFGQFHALVHHSFVEHRVCAVDGALSHGEHDHGGPALGDHHHDDHAHVADRHGVDLTADGPRDEGREPLLSPLESGEGHSEHCSTPTSPDQRKGLVAHTLQDDATSRQSVRPLPVRSQDGVEGVAVFRLAPKQSPPRIA